MPRRVPPPPRPANSADFDLSPTLEDHINALAIAAKQSPRARNQLHALLAGKIARFLRPWRGRCPALGDYADLQQESFLLFAALVADWSGEGSFARYFLGFFPWRLRHAIEAQDRRWPTDRLVLLPASNLLASLYATIDPTADATLLAGCSSDERLLLTLRLLDGYTVTEVASILGWSRRTTYRRWRKVLAALTTGLPAPPAALMADDTEAAALASRPRKV
jgi:DNA-directed RNA polymerase specialized sigma24 family protein